jgi:acylphosphatase
MLKRYLIIFEGRVQGVGFRYFVYRAAYTKNLTGSVRNMMNGNVEVEVQGDEEVIKTFLDTVRKGNGFSEIIDHSIKEIPVKDREKKFDITY